MTLRRVTLGEWLAGIAGIALLAATFLPWYGPHLPPGPFAVCLGGSCNQSAWHSLSVILAFIVITAVLGIALLIATINERSPAVPAAAAVWAIAFSVLTVLLVAYRLINPPGDAGVRWGGVVGLACVVGVAAGAWLALRRDVRP
jgi:hypothetical protein